jgi:hypothetical protein
VGPWACTSVFIYGGSVRTEWRRCDIGGATLVDRTGTRNEAKCSDELGYTCV